MPKHTPLSPEIERISPLIRALKDARIAKKLTQKSLAESLNIKQSHISRIESGTTNPTVARLVEIAHTLGCDLLLVPKEYTSLFVSLTRAKTEDTNQRQPLYRLDESDTE